MSGDPAERSTRQKAHPRRGNLWFCTFASAWIPPCPEISFAQRSGMDSDPHKNERLVPINSGYAAPDMGDPRNAIPAPGAYVPNTRNYRKPIALRVKLSHSCSDQAEILFTCAISRFVTAGTISSSFRAPFTL